MPLRVLVQGYVLGIGLDDAHVSGQQLTGPGETAYALITGAFGCQLAAQWRLDVAHLALPAHFTTETVPPWQLCGTTVAVVNSSPDDVQLEQLLTWLLRAVSPGFVLTPPTGGSLEAYVPVAVTGANHAGSGETDETLPSVSGSEARALIELMSARGIAQGELARLLGLDKSTVSRLAAGLERKGWLRRGRDADNQRYVRLYLTPEGGAIAARVLHAWHSRQARILATLSIEERAGLAAGIRGLVRGLAAEGLLTDAADQPVGS